LLARRAAQDVKVALVGEGADELFGGYPTYIGALAATRYNRMPRIFRAAVERIVTAWPVSDKKVALSYLAKRFVEAAERDPLSRHAVWTAAVPPSILRRLGLPPAIDAVAPDLTAPEDVLDAVQRHDFEHMLAEGLLTKADRAAMRWGLETRAPFLDPEVMAFAGTLPARERVNGARTKVFLKRYAKRYLPDAIVDRRKRGLSVPLNRWLRGPLRDWAAGALASPALDELGIAKGAAGALLDEHAAGRADHAKPLWALIVLSHWLEWRARQAGTTGAAPVRAMGARP
jgi:asparagine synthase (glutamine-hydrolysing)